MKIRKYEEIEMFNCYLNALLQIKEKKEVIYNIYINSDLAGFFASLRSVADYISYADKQGWIPYVRYGKKVLYAEKQRLFGTNNAFEYYFEQPISFLSRKYTMNPNVVNAKWEDLILEENKYNEESYSYRISKEYIDRMSYIYQKYIRLNKRTEKYITERSQKLINGKRTLGVHIRGTDFYKEFNNHPVPVQIEEYANKINKIVKEKGYEQVFVATDDKRCLKKLKQILDIPIVYYKNVKRSDSNRSVAFCSDERKYNNYYLGLEVLLDAYTLVACTGFIGCLSQVDIFVQIIKKSKREEFQYLEIIDNGTVKNERNCWEPKVR